MASSNRTTAWGVVLAVFLVGAALALNAPGGSNSIAGRGLSWAASKLFDAHREPAPAPSPSPSAVPAQAPAAPAPDPAPVAAAPAVPPRAKPLDPSARPAPEDVQRSAFRARANMSHAPAEIEFRNVFAMTTGGEFNAETPGAPFLGFCGEVRVPEGRGWGRPGWKPFFISETASLPTRGQGPYLDMANTSTLVKCADVKPSEDYSAAFQAGETGVRPAYMRLGRAS